MNLHESLPHDETLDPADWTETARLAHQMVDFAVGHMGSVRERPVWQPMTQEVRDSFGGPLPREPQSLDEIFAEMQRSLGVDDARVIDAEEVSRLIPHLNTDGMLGALWGPSDGYIDGTRTLGLQTVHLARPVVAYLEDHDEEYVLRCLRVTA